MSTTNVDVITAWGKGQPARSGNLSTDGNRLYSYALCIGEWRDGLPVVFNYTAHEDRNPFGHRVPSEGFYSMTTSHHVSLARRVGYCFRKDDIIRCECGDSGCPIHPGRSACLQAASETLRRVDMDGGKVYFCAACADDAYESGVFADAQEVA